MYRCLTIITITQQPSAAFPARNKTLTFNFVHEFETTDSWADFTNQAKITLPKNVYYRDATNKLQPLGAALGQSDNINMGGFSPNPPTFLRGDTVKIDYGYRYLDKNGADVAKTSTVFQGFISGVTSKKPVELECEDNMWKLKQLVAKNKTYTSKDTLETILKDLLQGTGFTVNALTSTTFGTFIVQNETVMEVLARIRKDYHFEAYFRGNELRCGALVYIEDDAVKDGKKVFKFQQNIISDDLNYKRIDDINLSAIAYSVNKKELSTTTKDGLAKTRRERLEVLVTQINGKFVGKQKPVGQTADFSPNTAGERRTLYFWDVQTADKLIDLATKELQKYYYTGLRGKFTTFAIPYVRQGDNVDLLDPILPERNGRYKVKSVKYTGGVNGHRQEIELDYKIASLDAKGNAI